MNENIFKVKADVFNALAHPLRLKILEKLRGGGCCVCQIIPLVCAQQSNVSHHLSILKKAGLVRSEKKGMEVWYYVVDQRIYEVIDAVGKCIEKSLRQNEKILRILIKERS